MLPGYFVSIESQDENHVVQRSIYILMRVAMKSGNMPGMKNVFIDRTKTALLRFFVLTVLRFRGHNFKNHRLAFRDELSLIAWQFGEQRQFQPLHDRFNSPQMMAANGNLVRGKDELEVLLVAATVEFRKDEMIVRQQQ
jgi:hypothetical protein